MKLLKKQLSSWGKGLFCVFWSEFVVDEGADGVNGCYCGVGGRGDGRRILYRLKE